MNLQHNLHIFLAVLLTALLSVMPGRASAAIRLELPDRVARGDAFVILARSDTPATHMTFDWRGKQITVPAEEKNGTWQAVAFLGVPLEEKKSQRSVTAYAGKATAKASLQIFNRKRPVQKLSVDKKYVSPPKEVMARIQRDREKTRAVLARFTPQRFWILPFERPVEGAVSSLFGLKRIFNGQPRGFHKGLDLRSSQGTPIKACADGIVALAEDLYFSGNAVYLDHGLGVLTSYLHMSKILVQSGEHVRKGQVIGLVGATGRVTGPHLHLSLFVQGTSVDIEPFLEAQKPSLQVRTTEKAR